MLPSVAGRVLLAAVQFVIIAIYSSIVKHASATLMTSLNLGTLLQVVVLH